MAGERFSNLLVNNTKMHKLEPWLKRARLNYTNNKPLLNQLRKIEVIFTKEEIYKVKFDDPNSKA